MYLGYIELLHKPGLHVHAPDIFQEYRDMHQAIETWYVSISHEHISIDLEQVSTAQFLTMKLTSRPDGVARILGKRGLLALHRSRNSSHCFQPHDDVRKLKVNSRNLSNLGNLPASKGETKLPWNLVLFDPLVYWRSEYLIFAQHKNHLHWKLNSA